MPHVAALWVLLCVCVRLPVMSSSSSSEQPAVSFRNRLDNLRLERGVSRSPSGRRLKRTRTEPRGTVSDNSERLILLPTNEEEGSQDEILQRYTDQDRVVAFRQEEADYAEAVQAMQAQEQFQQQLEQEAHAEAAGAGAAQEDAELQQALLVSQMNQSAVPRPAVQVIDLEAEDLVIDLDEVEVLD